MNLENKSIDLERIAELKKILNEVVCASSNSNVIKFFNKNDIYHKSLQEVTVLECSKKYKYNLIKRMKAKIELYCIYLRNEDESVRETLRRQGKYEQK